MHWGSFAIGFGACLMLIGAVSTAFSIWMVRGGGLDK